MGLISLKTHFTRLCSAMQFSGPHKKGNDFIYSNTEKKTMKKFLVCTITCLSCLLAYQNLSAQYPRFKVLAFYSHTVEKAHIDFADAAIQFFKELTVGNGFVFDTTSNMEDLNEAKIKD